MVMEYLEGSDLAHVLGERGPLPIETACDFIMQACEAVAEAHRLGIVHRDIKPHNLFMTRKANGHACVKVLDFGISKTLEQQGLGNDSSLTRTTAVMGSPHYMAPEQMRSARSVDARADVWALGVCLYQFLTGHVPFEAETMLELGGKVLHEPPIPLSQYRAGIPPELQDIVFRCLNKDPNARYTNAGELAGALAMWLTGSPTHTEWSGPQPAIPQSAFHGPDSALGAFSSPRPPRASDSHSHPSHRSGVMPLPTAPSASVPPTGVTVGQQAAKAGEAKRPVVLVAVGTFVAVLVSVSALLFVFARGRAPVAEITPPPASLPAAQPTVEPGATAGALPPQPAATGAQSNGALPAPPPTGIAVQPVQPPQPPSRPPPPTPAATETAAPAPVHHHSHHAPAAPAGGDAFDHL